MFDNMAQSCLQGGLLSAFFSLLILSLLGLGAAALIKYLFSPSRAVRSSNRRKPSGHQQLNHEGE